MNFKPTNLVRYLRTGQGCQHIKLKKYLLIFKLNVSRLNRYVAYVSF